MSEDTTKIINLKPNYKLKMNKLKNDYDKKIKTKDEVISEFINYIEFYTGKKLYIEYPYKKVG